MNLTTSWMQSDWTKALGWTFVHSLWQIALIGLLLFIVLRLVPGRSAHTRYTISTMALWVIVITALSTFIIMLPGTNELKQITGDLVLLGTTEPLSLTDKISAWLEVRMPMMLTIWSAGVTILMIRLALSLGWVRHMRSTATPDADVQLVLNQLIQRLKLNVKPGAANSALVSSPVTIGHLKPLILFPVGIINQISPKEVEAILTHELAHIVRRDYLSNMIQSFIETLFYYHPITWWISGIVRSERENRADDLAIAWCGDHLGYAKALMTVQEMQVRQGPSLAIGFASRKGAMLARIQRILNLPYKNHNQMEKTVLLSLTSLCFLAFTLTSHTPKVDKPDVDIPSPSVSYTVDVTTDSIPSKGTYRIHKKTEDQDISIEVEDGDIKELTVDGKEIQPEEFDAYEGIIGELFGAIEAPPAMEDFTFMMPPMPPMPRMPEMPFIMEGFEFEMPEMPEIPEMPEMQWEQFFDGNSMKWMGDGSRMAIMKGLGMDNMQILMDSARIIIISGSDTSMVTGDQIEMELDGNAPFIFHGDQIMKGEDMRQMQEAWRAQADQWRQQQQRWTEQYRSQADQLRAEQDKMRDELRHQQSGNADRQRQLEREMEMLEYIDLLPRLSLSDQMVHDGLVKAGEEVEVQLTPDKMKVNGEKMPEAIHQKYLKLYEQQQGLELSGNSKVEFTTKSKQRM